MGRQQDQVVSIVPVGGNPSSKGPGVQCSLLSLNMILAHLKSGKYHDYL